MTVVKIKPVMVRKVLRPQPLSPKLLTEIKVTGRDGVGLFDLFKKFVVVGGDFA